MTEHTVKPTNTSATSVVRFDTSTVVPAVTPIEVRVCVGLMVPELLYLHWDGGTPATPRRQTTEPFSATFDFGHTWRPQRRIGAACRARIMPVI